MSQLSDREIFELALKNITDDFAAYPGLWHRINPLGYDSEGMLDLEFPHMFLAMQWVQEIGVAPLVELRDPVKSLTSPVVLKVDLGTYARRFKLYPF